MNIIITGSLGQISMPLGQHLLENGHTVTIISSDRKKLADIEHLGAKAAIGSVEDADFLLKTFTGADAVYCMTPPNFLEPDQVAYYERIATAYANAIRSAGVNRVIYLSSYGAHLPSGTGFIVGSHRGENILNAINGIAITHIRPTYFYYNLFSFIPMIKSAGLIGAVYGGEDKLAMVAPEDIAHCIADELSKHRTGTSVRYVTSDDRSCSQVAQVLGDAIGKTNLTWKVLPSANVLQTLLSNGMPRNAAENLVELGTAIHTGALRSDFDNLKPDYGKISLEAFAKEFATAYNKQPIPH